MKAKTLSDYWEEFAERILHPDAPLVQRLEVRRAFYVGAASVLEAYLVIGTERDEEFATQVLRNLEDEITVFRRELGTVGEQFKAACGKRGAK